MPDTNKTPGPDADVEQPFISHLLELRNRLLRVVIAVVVVLVCLLPFANDLYTLLSGPLTRHMPQGSSMIAIEVASPFLAPFKLTLVLSIFVAMPFMLYQIWAFVAPGLYRHERRLVVPLVVSSTALFYAGMAFAYFAVFPLVFGFLTATAPEGVAVMTDINRYLDFVLTLFFAFGAAFEVPIATFILVWMGVTTPDRLAKMRGYVVVGIFVFAAILTPPDAVTQTLLAVPMWMLYELGVFMSRLFLRRREEAKATAERGMTDAEMEEELDRIEHDEAAAEADHGDKRPDQP